MLKLIMKNASFLKYIGVWLLWITATSILTFGIFFILAILNIYNDCSVINEIIVILVINFVGAITFINIYKLFPDLKISKVMIYLWILGFVGAGSIVAESRNSLEACNLDFNATYIAYSALIGYIFHNLTIRYYFKKKPQWDGKNLI